MKVSRLFSLLVLLAMAAALPSTAVTASPQRDVPSIFAAAEPLACYPTVAASVGVGAGPHGVAVNSAAKRIYVVNQGANTMSVLDSQTYAVIKTIPGGDGPNQVAYNPTNQMIYSTASRTGVVRVVRASDYVLIKKITVGSKPNGLAVNPVTNRVYVANYGSGTVSVINAATNCVIQTLAVGAEPAQVAVNSSTNKAYVTLHGAGRVAVINGAGSVKTVDIYSAGPYGIAIDTVRRLVYVATIDTFRIAVIDGSTDTFLGWAEIRRLPGGEPVPLRMIALNPSIGSSGHIFVTTAGTDGGWNKLLTLSKGWPEYFARAYALDLAEPREGIAFESSTKRVFVTSRTSNRLAAYRDGEPVCSANLAWPAGYQIKVCVARPDGTCRQVLTR